MDFTNLLITLVIPLILDTCSSTPNVGQANYVLYPARIYGSKRLSSISRLRCPSLTDSLSRVKRFEVKLATAEPRTRVGYICTGVTSRIQCGSSLFEYHTTSTHDLIDVSKSDCELMVMKFAHGHISGFKETTPDCAMGYSADKTDNQLLIRRQILPFSPVKNGVISPIFSNSVCENRYCLSSDGKHHWFLDEGEEPGCSGLVKGFVEFKISAVGRGGSQLLSTNIIGDTPIRDICKTQDYCGMSTFVDHSFNGFSITSLSGEIGDILNNGVGDCKSIASIREYRASDLKHSESLTDIIQHRHYKCQEVLNKAKKEGFLSSRYLTLFQPYLEGIAPGYRLENGKLWEYDLYYMIGLFTSQQVDRSSYQTYKWDIIDASGSSSPILHSLCLFNISFENSAGGSLCSWFNGIQIQGLNIFYPDIPNHFEYYRDYPLIQYSNIPDNVPADNSSDTNWIKDNMSWFQYCIGLTIIFIVITLISVAVRKLCKRTEKQDIKQIDNEEAGKVEIVELETLPMRQYQEHSPAPLTWNPPAIASNNSQSRMLEWFN